MENNSKRERGEGGEAASTAADNRKAPPLEAGSSLIAEDFALLLSFSLSRHAQNFAHKFKSKEGMGTQRSESKRGGRGARFEATNGKAGEVRVQVQQRSAKAKQSKVNNFANYAKANRQKVNINIHLAGVKRREGEGGVLAADNGQANAKQIENATKNVRRANFSTSTCPSAFIFIKISI